jgi:hypothetical protein
VNEEKRNNFDWQISHRANHGSVLTATQQTLRWLDDGIGEIDRGGDWKLKRVSKLFQSILTVWL